jgi:DNA-binding response OmpR family regulator
VNPHQAKPVKILLADRDESLRTLLGEYLRTLGYEVFSARNGREAVDVVRTEKPDLVILEMILPELDGLEVCRQLKSDASTREIILLFLTAKDDIDSRVNAFEAGADDHLAKPFSPRELEVRIIAALRRKRPELKLPDFKLPAAPADTVQVKRADRNGELVREALSTKKAKDPFRICGTVLNGKYELTEFAGSGGMGAVYRALNLIDRTIVAVKILQPHIVTRNPEYAELFEREAKNAQGLDHQHIVKVFDSGKDEDLSYMVMEWVEGNSVEEVLTQGQLPLDRLTNIFEQICSAVAFAHGRNIIHLDLKPGNILLLDRPGPEDFVKVIDFGLSRVISKESGTTVTKFRGTHQYCAPEQFGGRVSHRSDIYSLGATLYYLLTGVIPFGTSYINAKMHPNLDLPQIPSVVRQRNLPSALDYVISKALNKNPTLRQQSAKQLFEEFNVAMSGKALENWSRSYETSGQVGERVPANSDEPTRIVPNVNYILTDGEHLETAKQEGPFYEFGNFRLFPDRQALWRRGIFFRLHHLHFKLLLLLIKNRGAVVTIDRIRKEVIGKPYADNSVYWLIYELRKLLDDGPNKSTQLIQTVRGQGYRFIAEVREHRVPAH